MKLSTALTCLALSATCFGGFAGCEKSRDEMRPDLDSVVSGEHGPQSRDLREMTDRMAPDLLQIPEIVRNQYRVTIVMKTPKNMTTDPTRDMTIFVARLKALLNSSSARDKVAFVEEQATLRNFQAQELGGANHDPFEDASRNPNAPQPVDPRVRPQYVLTGDFYEMHNGRTSYWLFTFHLLDINTGVQVWEKPYEVRTLN
jgi:hypothetical protein